MYYILIVSHIPRGWGGLRPYRTCPLKKYENIDYFFYDTPYLWSNTGSATVVAGQAGS